MTDTQTNFTKLISLQTVCLKQNIPFVSYRLPLQTEITSLVQYSSCPRKVKSYNELEYKSGFVISPFVLSNQCATYLLQPDKIFIDNDIDDVEIECLSQIETFCEVQKPHAMNLSSTLKSDFIHQVHTAQKAMALGQFDKVVLSKVKCEELKNEFSAEQFFLKLCQTYPSAFVYLLQMPEAGCWIGASPEPLLVIDAQCVKTVSLAGTQLATDASINSHVWSTKEIEEQGIVTDFVEKTLQHLTIKNYSKVGPINYRAANLIHLKTAFEFAPSEVKSQLGNLIDALHPTPSVGGLPKTAALTFILEHEKHNRTYYSGFLGPVNIHKQSNLFVNLRCMQLFENQISLYSGAGITPSSVAENEWVETDNKLMTLMKLL